MKPRKKPAVGPHLAISVPIAPMMNGPTIGIRAPINIKRYEIEKLNKVLIADMNNH